jgi:hypothetical protein
VASKKGEGTQKRGHEEILCYSNERVKKYNQPGANDAYL